MSLLGDIAAALSEGIGNGMVANAKWGIEEEAQAKKEAEDNARLEKNLAINQKQIDSNNAYREGMLQESKADREARAEENRLDRESRERLARIDAGSRSSSGGSKRNALDALQMLDTTIKDLDKQRSILLGDLQEAQTDAEKTRIQAQIDTLTTNRRNLINSPETALIVESNGQIGASYISQYFEPKVEQQQDQHGVPESLIRPPQRPSAGDGGLLMKMVNNQQETTEQSSPQPAAVQSWGDIGNKWKTNGFGNKDDVVSPRNLKAPTPSHFGVVDRGDGSYSFGWKDK